MSKLKKDQYDVVIIGAGIGGLVCGCYLAQSGLRVAIFEKHDKPGGYCTSFVRKGFLFDVGVHYLGGCHNNGQINRVLKELGMLDRLDLLHYDPTDRIVTPDHEVLIRKHYKDTLEGLQIEFKEESRKLQDFFNFLTNPNFYEIYTKTKHISFKELLDSFFVDKKLKSIFGILLGNIGLSPSRASALSATVLYRDFILQPGSYPKGGVQKLPNLLAERFQEYGGELFFNNAISEILMKDSKVYGVVCERGKQHDAKVCVSNADAKHTFFSLIKNSSLQSKQINKLETSMSAFAVYLGVNLKLHKILRKKCAIWNFSTYDLEACYGDFANNIHKKPLPYIVCTFPSLNSSAVESDKHVVELFLGAPFKTQEFWAGFKDELAAKAVAKADEVIKGLSDNIEMMIVGTPQTFFRYTHNNNGAMYGWASTPSQIDRNIFPQRTNIPGLYLAGHWCTNGLGQGGISGVAYSGRHIAKIICNRLDKGALSIR